MDPSPRNMPHGEAPGVRPDEAPGTGSAVGTTAIEPPPGAEPGRVDAREVDPTRGRPRRPNRHPEREIVGTGWFWSLIIGSLLALVAVVFVLQNSDTVPVEFLGWDGDVSLAGVVLVVALGAIVLDELIGVVYRRRRRRRLTERAALSRRAGDARPDSS